MSNPVDDYIDAQAPELQAKLRELKQLIMEVDPNLEQKMSWGMPTFRKRVNQIHFAVQKKHIGIYPGPAALEAFAEQLKSYHTSKGAMQIPFEREIDKDLIQAMLRYNLENDR